MAETPSLSDYCLWVVLQLPDIAKTEATRLLAADAAILPAWPKYGAAATPMALYFRRALGEPTAQLGFGGRFKRDYRPEVRRDCALVPTPLRFYEMKGGEVGLYLREVYGAALDAHDDPRGALTYPDHKSPSGQNYAEIVAELDAAEGDEDDAWEPLGAIGDIPRAYSKAEAGSVENYIFQMMEVVGRDGAIALGETARRCFQGGYGAPHEPDAIQRQHDILDRIAAWMGDDFADAYEIVLARETGWRRRRRS